MGLRDWHGRVHTKCSGFIGTGGNNPPGAYSTSDDYRFAEQRRIVPLLHGGEKGVQVAVNYVVGWYIFIELQKDMVYYRFLESLRAGILAQQYLHRVPSRAALAVVNCVCLHLGHLTWRNKAGSIKKGFISWPPLPQIYRRCC